MWVYVKGVLRKLKARTEEALLDAVVEALDCVTPELVATSSNTATTQHPHSQQKVKPLYQIIALYINHILLGLTKISNSYLRDRESKHTNKIAK
jgi:hypothetical protein